MSQRNAPRSHRTSNRIQAHHQNLKEALKTYLDFEDRNNCSATSYLRKDQLSSFWQSNQDSIRSRFGSGTNRTHGYDHNHDDPEHGLFQQLCQNYQRVFCIVVWIDQPITTRLRDLVASRDPTACDRTLPWSLGLAKRYLGDFSGEYFFENQYGFLEPIAIGQPRPIGLRFDDFRSFPFIGPTEFINNDAPSRFGTVRVHREYYPATRLLTGNVDTTQSIEHQASGDDIQIGLQVLERPTELEIHTRTNLDLIKELRSHENIVAVYDTVFRDQALYNFFLSSPLGDLDTLLVDGTHNVGGLDLQSRRGFIQQFPNANFLTVLQAFSGLLHGLKHLYDICSKHGQHLYSLQVEFSPKNVLVFPEANQPAGRWKIFDFSLKVPERDDDSGIDIHLAAPDAPPADSTIRISDIQITNSTVIIGHTMQGQDHTARSSQPGLITRSRRTLETPYRAPEVGSNDDRNMQYTTIWQVGCVFVEILAFCKGFSQAGGIWEPEQSQLRALRAELSGHHFYSVQSSPETGIASYLLRDSVRDRLREWKSDPLFTSAVRVAKRCLKRQPEARPTLSGLLEGSEGSEVSITDTLHDIENIINQPGLRSPFIESPEDEGDVNIPWTPSVSVQENVRRKDLPMVSSSSHWSLILCSDVIVLAKQVPSTSHDIFWIQPLDAIQSSGAHPGIYELDTKVNWHDLRFEGRFGCMLSKSDELSERQPMIFDVLPAKIQSLTFLEEFPRGPMRMLAVASNGTVAVCYDQYIHLRAIQGTQPDTIPAINKNAEFVKMSFRGDGLQLFVYVQQGREHIIQVWDVGIGRKPSHVADVTIQRYDTRHLPKPEISISPSIWRNTCIVLHRDLIMIAQAGGPNEARRQSGPVMLVEKGLRMTQAALSLASDRTSLLLVDDSCVLRAYRILIEGIQMSLVPIGSIALPNKKPIWALVRTAGPEDEMYKYHVLVGCKGLQEYKYGTNLKTSPRGKSLPELVLEDLTDHSTTVTTEKPPSSTAKARRGLGTFFTGRRSSSSPVI